MRPVPSAPCRRSFFLRCWFRDAVEAPPGPPWSAHPRLRPQPPRPRRPIGTSSLPTPPRRHRRTRNRWAIRTRCSRPAATRRRCGSGRWCRTCGRSPHRWRCRWATHWPSARTWSSSPTTPTASASRAYASSAESSHASRFWKRGSSAAWPKAKRRSEWRSRFRPRAAPVRPRSALSPPRCRWSGHRSSPSRSKIRAFASLPARSSSSPPGRWPLTATCGRASRSSGRAIGARWQPSIRAGSCRRLRPAPQPSRRSRRVSRRRGPSRSRRIR